MRFHVIVGGTFVDVAPHFALAAPAFGTVGRQLAAELAGALARAGRSDASVCLHLTRMALGGADRDPADAALLEAAGLQDLRTNDDVAGLLDHLVADPATRAIVLPAALCDFEPAARSPGRLSSEAEQQLTLRPAAKLARRVRAIRKDIFLALFKNTAGDEAPRQYARGLALLKRSSANLVLANDTRTRLNMVITPEQARYHETTDRRQAIAGFAEMIALRSGLRFTRSTVVPGEPVPWGSEEVPATLRAVVDHCIRRGAYKPFLGVTVGHFAVRAAGGTLLTSRRKTDFNQLGQMGLVRIEELGDDTVVAHGSRPSVGGQSQRMIFRQHPEVDCIVHFHCPTRPGSTVARRSQRPYECGSHECGRNTSEGLQAAAGPFAGIKAVMLEQHGPNVVFPAHLDPTTVIAFIEENFDLAARTDGEVDVPPLKSEGGSPCSSAPATGSSIRPPSAGSICATSRPA